MMQVLRAKDMPGAGQYNTYKSVGKQPLSIKKTLPAHSFGKSTRDASKKVRAEYASAKASGTGLARQSWHAAQSRHLLMSTS